MQAQRRVGDVDVRAVEVELVDEQVEEVRRHAALDLDAQRLAEATSAQLDLEGHQQVVGLVLFEREVGVARHAKEVRAPDGHAREEAAEVGHDEVLEQAPRDLRPPGRNRGSELGTLTRALRSSPVDSSRTVTAMLSERFEIIGKGCPGSTASGVSTG